MLRNTLIIGSARSGSSLVAGLVHSAGHHLGTQLLPADRSNPHGYFEDVPTLAINEQLLAPHTDTLPTPRFVPGTVYDKVPRQGRRWMSALPIDTPITATPDDHTAMRATITQSPWCRKDPRFCYTLPAWEPILGNAIRICVFREPECSAHSMMTWARPRDVGLTYTGALEIWAAAYDQILRRHRHHGDWIFVHYNQILDGSAIPAIEYAIGGPVDRDFPDPSLRRSSTDGIRPTEVDTVYRQMCAITTIPLGA